MILQIKNKKYQPQSASKVIKHAKYVWNEPANKKSQKKLIKLIKTKKIKKQKLIKIEK